MKLRELFHIGKRKVETGLDKLVSVQTRIDVAKADCEEALERQKKNATELVSAKMAFDAEYEKLEKQASCAKTQVRVLKDKGVSKDDEDFILKAQAAMEYARALEDMKKQKDNLEDLQKKVEKMLKQYKLNKSLLDLKASVLKTKINMYQLTSNLTDDQLLDVDTVFADVTEAVDKVERDAKAEQYVNALVQGKDAPGSSVRNAELDSFIDSI